MEKIRLQKFFTDNKIMSRRSAEKVIEAGNVKINGVIAKVGDKVDPENDIVEYNGKVIKYNSSAKTYIMLNKPLGYVTTMSDEKGRETVLSLVSDIKERIYPVGRLDMDSEGLLLMTDDGELTNALTHPKHHIAKYYDVRVAGEVTRTTLAELSSEMVIDGYKILPVECAVVSKKEEYTVIRMVLFEGRNRQIRKMCEKCGLTVKKLRRIAIGDLELDVAKGRWRHLTLDEIDYLRTAAGLEVIRY